MFLHSLSFLAAFPVIGVIGGQVPLVDGVLGGVPNSFSQPQVLEDTSTAATTPGALRVTENSGICGK